MTCAVDHVPLETRSARPASPTWRLLAILPRLVRQRVSGLDPERLPPHLLRDLGLTDHGFRSRPDDPWFR
jgi:hypothetical protein